MIVPALALPTKLAASAYIVMFVLGTVAAMGAYTGVIGEPGGQSLPCLGYASSFAWCCSG